MAQMTDLIAVAEKTARDPLVGAFAIMAVGVLVSRLLFEQQPIWRAIARVVFLILLTMLLLRNGIVPYEALRSSGAPAHDAIAGTLKIAWWLWAAWFLVALIRSVVVFERRPLEGKLVQDLVSALIYLAAAFAIIAYVFDLPVQGLLATSGAIAIVLGLALQSTLNDVFSGLVLSLSRPFRPGDWINIEGGTEGHVLEMNWRATHVLTSRQDLAIVPNSTIAKSKIVNVSFPSRVHGLTVAVQLSSRTPPGNGVHILELALLNCRAILSVALSHCRIEHAAILPACRTHVAATISCHVCIAEARKARCVLAEVRCRWTLKVFWTAACTERNLCADPALLKPCILRSRRRVG
jgi:small-conductance mechanosensitive channel